MGCRQHEPARRHQSAPRPTPGASTTYPSRPSVEPATCANERRRGNRDQLPYGSCGSIPMGVGKVMPDITMCTNSNCRLRKHCYRYRAIPADYQSWGTFDCRIGHFIPITADEIGHFIPITADDRLRSMDEIEGGAMDEIEGGASSDETPKTIPPVKPKKTYTTRTHQ